MEKRSGELDEGERECVCVCEKDGRKEGLKD